MAQLGFDGTFRQPLVNEVPQPKPDSTLQTSLSKLEDIYKVFELLGITLPRVNLAKPSSDVNPLDEIFGGSSKLEKYIDTLRRIIDKLGRVDELVSEVAQVPADIASEINGLVTPLRESYLDSLFCEVVEGWYMGSANRPDNQITNAIIRALHSWGGTASHMVEQLTSDILFIEDYLQEEEEAILRECIQDILVARHPTFNNESIVLYKDIILGCVESQGALRYSFNPDKFLRGLQRYFLSLVPKDKSPVFSIAELVHLRRVFFESRFFKKLVEGILLKRDKEHKNLLRERSARNSKRQNERDDFEEDLGEVRFNAHFYISTAQGKFRAFHLTIQFDKVVISNGKVRVIDYKTLPKPQGEMDLFEVIQVIFIRLVAGKILVMDRQPHEHGQDYRVYDVNFNVYKGEGIQLDSLPELELASTGMGIDRVGSQYPLFNARDSMELLNLLWELLPFISTSDFKNRLKNLNGQIVIPNFEDRGTKDITYNSHYFKAQPKGSINVDGKEYRYYEVSDQLVIFESGIVKRFEVDENDGSARFTQICTIDEFNQRLKWEEQFRTSPIGLRVKKIKGSFEAVIFKDGHWITVAGEKLIDGSKLIEVDMSYYVITRMGKIQVVADWIVPSLLRGLYSNSAQAGGLEM